ncbi:hypothetical protein EVAR_57675_1 [Eumeta japonica]|uniref:Uncharacterized protein n=1 Tax=Eumeta variegata TaxID=151549 RepID=A0A4C1YQ28_EUMVA|nr:hypothetical protein EVAR_57675_1 [Eumeta japonica]
MIPKISSTLRKCLWRLLAAGPAPVDPGRMLVALRLCIRTSEDLRELAVAQRWVKYHILTKCGRETPAFAVAFCPVNESSNAPLALSLFHQPDPSLLDNLFTTKRLRQAFPYMSMTNGHGPSLVSGGYVRFVGAILEAALPGGYQFYER